MPLPDTDRVTAAWIDSLQAAYSEAKARRHRTLAGEYVSGFDVRGIHAFSFEVGCVFALQHQEPVLTNAGFDPRLLRKVAEQDANDQFADEIRAATPTQEEAA